MVTSDEWQLDPPCSHEVIRALDSMSHFVGRGCGLPEERAQYYWSVSERGLDRRGLLGDDPSASSNAAKTPKPCLQDLRNQCWRSFNKHVFEGRPQRKDLIIRPQVTAEGAVTCIGIIVKPNVLYQKVPERFQQRTVPIP